MKSCAFEGRHLVGIFSLSVATLLLELALIRVMSVALWYHFGFLVVSTALLGFGAAGVTTFLWPWARERGELDLVLASFSFLFGVLAIASFWLPQHVPRQMSNTQHTSHRETSHAFIDPSDWGTDRGSTDARTAEKG